MVDCNTHHSLLLRNAVLLEFQGWRVGQPKFLCPEKKERNVPDSTLLYDMRAGTRTSRMLLQHTVLPAHDVLFWKIRKIFPFVHFGFQQSANDYTFAHNTLIA